MKDLISEEVEGAFYEPELQKVDKERDAIWKINEILKLDDSRKRSQESKSQTTIRQLAWLSNQIQFVDRRERYRTMNTDQWVVMSSDNPLSMTYYPDNVSSKFTCHLDQRIVMDGMRFICLRVIFARRRALGSSKKKNNVDELLYVYCSLCEPVNVDGRQQSLLRRLKTSKNNTWNVVVDQPYFMNTRIANIVIGDISVYIEDGHGQPATFLDDPVTLTLQLKRYPFVNL